MCHRRSNTAFFYFDPEVTTSFPLLHCLLYSIRPYRPLIRRPLAALILPRGVNYGRRKKVRCKKGRKFHLNDPLAALNLIVGLMICNQKLCVIFPFLIMITLKATSPDTHTHLVLIT